MTEHRVLLIGQAPGRTADPDAVALISKTGRCRLAELAGIPANEFLELIETRNIFSEYTGTRPPTRAGKKSRGDQFDRVQAMANAAQLPIEGRRVVFMGRAVARAFGHTRVTYFEPLPNTRAQAAWCAPHPSGLNRWWNDPQHRADAQTFFKSILGVA